MPPIAPARPLWWLARWAARLLTGFAVAAAFTLGAWAPTPDAVPADQGSVAAFAPPLAATVPSAAGDWERAAAHDLAGLPAPVEPTTGEHTDLTAMPGFTGRPGLTVGGAAGTRVTPLPAGVTGGVQSARAPPLG